MSSTSAQGLTALSGTLLGLSTIAVSLRFYARRTQKASLRSDDWIMIPCLVSRDNPMIGWYKWPKACLNDEITCRYCSSARHRVLFMVSGMFHDRLCDSTDGNSLPGLDKRVLGYPTPKDSPIPVKTAEMTSKVFKWPVVSRPQLTLVAVVHFFRLLFYSHLRMRQSQRRALLSPHFLCS